MTDDGVAIRLRGVDIRYQRDRRIFGRSRDSFTALQDVTLDIRRGEKLGIVGRNGAGKSTLLRVLAGVLRPDSGTVERDHGSCRLLALGSGFMPNLTGRENAVLSGLMLGMRRPLIVSRLEQVKAFAALGDFFEQPVRTYSTGMRSRLGFAVAIQQAPDVLLIDETLAVGDATFKAKCLVALRDRMKAGSTVVLVSHSANTIEDVCSRAVLLANGRVDAIDNPKAVLAKYDGKPHTQKECRVS